MASKLSPATPRPKVQRGSGVADGERMSPATKAGAANMLGDNSPKATRSPRSFSTEKKTPVSRGAELHQVQEELAKTKEQLALMEKSKSNLLQDLARSKRQLDELNSKLQDANEVSKKDKLRAEEMQHASFTAAEDWQIELEITKKQYEAAIVDLQANKQAMENLKHELFVCIEAKDEAVRLAGEAMNAAESTAKRVEEMSAELIVAKGSSIVADSAPARVDELMADLSSAREGLAEITATCDKSTKDAAALITAKEAELQNSLQEISHLRSEAETSKQELALAQESIRQQTTYANSIKETAALLAEDKEVELQNALQEVSHLRSVSASLKEELAGVQKSVMQQTIGEKSAKVEAAALLANKDVELQDAIQEASLLRSELEGLKQELDLAQKSVEQQTGGPDALELYQTELVAAKKAERISEARLLNMMSELDRLRSELKCAKAAENKSSTQLAYAMSELEQLKNELAAASEAKEKALVAKNAASALSSKMNAEVAKAKESESVALASLSVACVELKEAQDNLAKAIMEGTVIAGFLESLKADFERIQLDLANIKGKEMHANERVEFLSLELTNVKETSQIESKLLNEQVANAQAAVESLKLDAERQWLDMFEIIKKEALANEKVIHVTGSLQNAENELAELKRQLLTASDNNDVLAKQLNVSVKEISEMKERELSMNTRVASLVQALEDKEYELVEWERRVGISDSTSTAIALDLKNTKAELLERKERESCASAKATALSVLLASLTEKNEVELNELKEREAVVNAKVAALDAELKRTKLDFEEVLSAAKVSKDEAERLQVSLELATLEVDHARQETQKISAEAAWNKEDANAALVESQEAKAEAGKAREAAQLAESEVQKQSQEIMSLALNLQMAQDQSNLAKVKAESLSDKLRVAMAELQASREEMEQLRQEAQASQKDSEMLQSSISREKEQAVLAAQSAREEVERIQKEMDIIKLNEERAQALSKTSEDRLQDALKELQIIDLNATCVQEEASRQTDLSENENNRSTPQEELENLKTKVQETEEHLAVALKEVENSHANTQNLLRNLETMKLEKEANEKAFLEVHQHLADTEKAKSNLEAEIQRLLDESKQWQTVKDAIDIPIHSEVLGRNFSSDCRDEKPQPDSPNAASEIPASPSHESVKGEEELVERQERVMKEHMALREDLSCLSLRREDTSEKEECNLRDEAVLHDELASIPTKKKKKTLLVRLGTLLEKKKHTSQHTP